MSNLSEYIRQLKEYIEQNPNMTEVEIIRHVYLDLGQRFSFNLNFLPFGNGRKRQEIYLNSRDENQLEECMENNIVICKSAAYIIEYILKAVGVNIKTVRYPNDMGRYPHVYNIVTPKDGGEPYTIDLQDDMKNIQSHSFTANFGLSVEDGERLVISRFEQEQMDRKSGYIDDEHYYSDEYLYLIKSDIGFFENFDEKVKFVLENIDVYDNPNMQYAERQWHHVKLLEELFTDKEFNYQRSDGKIRMVDCYKDIKGVRHYVNCIAVLTANGTQMYVYNKKQYRYVQMDLKAFARAVNKGLVLHNCKVPGLGQALREVKGENGGR